MTTLDDLRRANLKEQRAQHEETLNPNEKSGPQLELATMNSTSGKVANDTAAHPLEISDTASPFGNDALVRQVREVVAKRRVHGTGVKATVDMPPELFRRVKSYCKDHNNATLRQLFLDLMGAFLDAEGY